MTPPILTLPPPAETLWQAISETVREELRSMSDGQAQYGSPETGVGGCGAYRKALASLGTRSPRARSAAAVNPLRGSSATLRPSG